MLSSYSHSSLQSFRNCPRKFKFQYIEKPSVPRRPSVEAYLGNSVHRVLQKLYRAGSDGVEIPLEEAGKLYEAEWAKPAPGSISVVSDFHGVDDYIRMGHEMLTTFYEQHRPFREGTLLGTEMHLSFTLPGTPFKFRGVVDRLWKRDDGVVEICDYKTGRKLPRPQDPDFFYQMGLYQLAVQANHPQYDNIEVAHYMLKLNEVVRHRLTVDDLEILTEDLRQAVLATLNAEKMDDFPTREGPLCNWCDYAHLCPAKRHGLMLEAAGEEGDEEDVSARGRRLATEYIDKDREKKALEAELKVLRSELREAAEEMEADKLEGENGEVGVKVKRVQKFPTKSRSPREAVALSEIVREHRLEQFLKVDETALMKDGYLAGRLDKEVRRKLEPLVIETETVTVRVYPKEEPADDDGGD